MSRVIAAYMKASPVAQSRSWSLPILRREELQNFRRKQNPKTSHVSFEHWRAGDHDDLVLAVAMACRGPTARRGSRRLRLY